jgi:hypothetical protein
LVCYVAVSCGSGDSCLDHGGSWNSSVEACEFHEGPIVDAEAAVLAGRLTLRESFGPQVDQQAPFDATLDNGAWHVRGTSPRDRLGGVANVWLDAETGRVQRVLHGQ